ncbi:MAG: hypothetical protein NTW21_08620 [Verrucomicrobia bacterium]|nr:hypothetical protein [Verrucomicrobiota bacterium]
MKNQAPLFVLAIGSLTAATPLPYGRDVEFLRQHTAVIELKNGDAAVALAPAYQGRVMTSTAAGDGGYSFGWLNYKVIEQGILPEAKAVGKLESHIYVFGGEERFWLGPEGGQFGIFFPAGAKFEFANWKTPPPLDTQPFAVVSSSASQADFQQDFAVSNHSGTHFEVAVQRRVRLLTKAELTSLLGVALPADLKLVAYETSNQLTNRGNQEWQPDTGLLSVWLLGMYKPSAETVVAIPFRQGEAQQLGPVVNDAYFGKVPAERLKVRDGVIYFKGDGTQRGKIGIPPRRSLGVAGSYSGENQALTLVLYEQPKTSARYVNSAWEQQQDPFSGDVINSYNDGSPAPGEPPLGPFYELETSSPAAALKPGASIMHRQTTIHLVGDAQALDALALKQLHTSLTVLKSIFTPEK